MINSTAVVFTCGIVEMDELIFDAIPRNSEAECMSRWKQAAHFKRFGCAMAKNLCGAYEPW